MRGAIEIVAGDDLLGTDAREKFTRFRDVALGAWFAILAIVESDSEGRPARVVLVVGWRCRAILEYARIGRAVARAPRRHEAIVRVLVVRVQALFQDIVGRFQNVIPFV